MAQEEPFPALELVRSKGVFLSVLANKSHCVGYRDGFLALPDTRSQVCQLLAHQQLCRPISRSFIMGYGPFPGHVKGE